MNTLKKSLVFIIISNFPSNKRTCYIYLGFYTVSVILQFKYTPSI